VPLLILALAGLSAAAFDDVSPAAVPPPIKDLTIPAGLDPDAYCFVQVAAVKSALADTKEPSAELNTQREAVGIGLSYYVGALSRRFDKDIINARVGAVMRHIVETKMADEAEASGRAGLLCAYAARDRLHNVANGMRATMGVAPKNP
jgi:hypothetical protein